MIKWSICQEDIKITTVYMLNNKAPKYKQQKLTELKGRTENLQLYLEILTFLSEINKVPK